MTEWWDKIEDLDSDDYSYLFDRDEDVEDEEDFAELDIDDIDFSSIEGSSRKERFKNIRKKTTAQIIPKKPLNKSRKIISKKPIKKKVVTKISLPSDKEILVKGVDGFILSQTDKSEAIKNIGYYKGEKLKEMVLIFNNTSPNDFVIELFNPSQPLDYLYATSLNLNNKVAVAGDNKVSYSDVLFNLLANPAIVPNAKFVCEGARVDEQESIALRFKNKNVAGYEKVMPIQMSLNLDIDQQQRIILYWDIQQTLGHVYCPDGMDVIEYRVLAGMRVTFCFYYKQVSLKKFFWQETRNKGIL
jgi:hypothetical protein